MTKIIAFLLQFLDSLSHLLYFSVTRRDHLATLLNRRLKFLISLGIHGHLRTKAQLGCRQFFAFFVQDQTFRFTLQVEINVKRVLREKFVLTTSRSCLINSVRSVRSEWLCSRLTSVKRSSSSRFFSAVSISYSDSITWRNESTTTPATRLPFHVSRNLSPPWLIVQTVEYSVHVMT